MPRFDLFSKRQNDAAKSGQTDVYRYDIVTSPFRRQLLNIAKPAFGEHSTWSVTDGSFKVNNFWKWIDTTYSHEKGIDPLGGKEHAPEKIRSSFLSMDSEEAFDILDLIGFAIQVVDNQTVKEYHDSSDAPTPRIDEVNYRLREAGMGYQFEGGRLTRIDSQLGRRLISPKPQPY